MELYTGEPIADLDDVINTFRQRTPNDQDNSQIFNVTYSVLSTIESRIASFRPRAQFLPNGSDGKAKRAAREMTALSDAWADAVDYQGEAVDALADLLTGDAGCMKLYEEDDTIKLGRFPSWEFLVDESDGKYGLPQCLYHVRRITTQQAASMLGIDEKEITQSGTWDTLKQMVDGSGLTKIRIVDAWQRGPDGTHVVLIGDKLLDGGVNLTREPWEYDGFPVVVERYRKSKQGMWGRSAISMHRAAQVELNEMQITAREAHRMSATKIIHVQSTEQAPTKINNAYVSIDTYTNQPCSIETPPAWNPENYQYIKIIRDQVYETHGVSQYQAVANHQPGMTSKVAISEDSEQQSDRLAILSQKWERMRVETAKWWWRMTRDLAKRMEEEGRDSKPKWKAISKGSWKEMVFEDIESEYEIGIFPSSLFGHSIAGRFQKADNLIEKGWITREDALANLDVPDLMPTVDLILAEQYAMEKIVDSILEDEKYITPDPIIRPEKMFGYARSRYLLAWSQDAASPKALDLMRRLINAKAPKPAPTVPPPGASPVAPGGPPPDAAMAGAPMPPPGPGGAPIAPPGVPGGPAMPPMPGGPPPTGAPPDAVPLGPSVQPMIQ